MKLLPVANRINFKGLFTDKSRENHGQWKMEYQPYSWEMKNSREYGMSNQVDFDIFAKELPDNEKIFRRQVFKNIFNTQSIYMDCHDILCTKFYYNNVNSGSARDRIDEMKAMNLEDSLRVRDKKLAKFIELKEAKQQELKAMVEKEFKNFKVEEKKFEEATSDFHEDLSSRIRSKSSNKEIMDSSYRNMSGNVLFIKGGFDDYLRLENSKEAVKKLRESGQAMIRELETAREEGKLIDISRRDIYDPNKLLWQIMHDVKLAAGKLVALPHRTISVNELLKMIGSNVKEADIPAKCVRIVDELIHTRL